MRHRNTRLLQNTSSLCHVTFLEVEMALRGTVAFWMSWLQENFAKKLCKTLICICRLPLWLWYTHDAGNLLYSTWVFESWLLSTRTPSGTQAYLTISSLLRPLRDCRLYLFSHWATHQQLASPMLGYMCTVLGTKCSQITPYCEPGLVKLDVSM